MNFTSEIVNCTDRTMPAIMLIEAMTREADRADLQDHFNLPNVPLNSAHVVVQLTINGVPVNFCKTAQEMWDRLVSKYGEHVSEKAKELVQLTRFSKLEQILSDAEDEITREIENAMNK
jgi:predicted lipid-binding transport protein (Tim44 family)